MTKSKLVSNLFISAKNVSKHLSETQSMNELNSIFVFFAGDVKKGSMLWNKASSARTSFVEQMVEPVQGDQMSWLKKTSKMPPKTFVKINTPFFHDFLD
jgi:hypothetical protein